MNKTKNNKSDTHKKLKNEVNSNNNEFNPEKISEIIPDEIINTLSEKTHQPKKEILRALSVSVQSPYLPPWLMEGYKKVDPNFPERLLTHFEKQQDFEHKETSKNNNRNFIITILGMLFPTIVILAQLTAATAIILILKNTPGYFIGTAFAGSGFYTLFKTIFSEKKDAKK